MKRLTIVIVVFVSLIILSIITGTAAALTIDGALVQAFRMEVNIETPSINATIDIKPDSLQLKSQGEPVNAFIQLPEGFHPEDILLDTVRLSYDRDGDGTIEENESVPAENTGKPHLSDHGGAPCLRVTFSRTAIIDLLESVDLENVTLVVSGLVGEIKFLGGDTIKLLH